MVLPTAYLGPIAYYQSLLASPTVEIEQWETFPKRTCRNRCSIAGVNGIQMLTIPVLKCDHHQTTREVKISYHLPWQQQHWMALRSAYEHTPFFEYMEDAFRPYYEKQVEYLIDWNTMLQTTVLDVLERMGGLVSARPIRTSEWQGPLSETVWQPANSIDSMAPYAQVFADRQGFQPNLSIVDLLFNLGPESILYLRQKKQQS